MIRGTLSGSLPHLGSEQQDFEIQLSLCIGQPCPPATKAFLLALFSVLTKTKLGLEGRKLDSVKSGQQAIGDLGSSGQ